MVLVQAIGILAVAAVSRPAAGLHVGDPVRRRAKHSQEGFRMHGARAHLNVVRLLQNTIAPGPKSLQLQDQLLKSGSLEMFKFCFRFQGSRSSPASNIFLVLNGFSM